MRQAVFVVMTVLAACSGNLFAELPDEPEVEQLLEIANKPHRELLELRELHIYPDIRKYEVTAESFAPDGRSAKIGPFEINEKWVDGKYVVSKFKAPWDGQTWHLIVTFDAGQGIYRKWVFTDDEFKSYMIGTRVGDTRTLALTGVISEDDMKTVSHESHSDDESRWSEVGYRDGKVVYRIVGRAVKASDE